LEFSTSCIFSLQKRAVFYEIHVIHHEMLEGAKREIRSVRSAADNWRGDVLGKRPVGVHRPFYPIRLPLSRARRTLRMLHTLPLGVRGIATFTHLLLN
jgi:hypothetical protein